MLLYDINCYKKKNLGCNDKDKLTTTRLCTKLDVSLLSTAVDCGTLTAPANGQVSYSGRTTFGHTATYRCNTGYNLIGGTTRMCQARGTTGAWSGNAPTCHRMFILNSSLSSITGSYIQYSSFNSRGLWYSD